MNKQEIVPEVVTDVQKFNDRGDAEVPVVQGDSPNAVVMMAMRQNYTPELIEKMMDLAERNERNVAKRAYVKAIAEFKKNAPLVHKDKENTHFKSYYASKGAIVNTIAPAMAEYGLTHRWEIEQPDGLVKVTCVLTHDSGHSESSTMQGPPDQSGGGSKNPIQQIKSTRTYLQVATFEDVTGTASSDDSDDDGNKAGKDPEYINTDQVTVINDLIKETGANKKLFLRWAKAESVETILATKYQFAEDELNRKKANLRQPGDE